MRFAYHRFRMVGRNRPDQASEADSACDEASWQRRHVSLRNRHEPALLRELCGICDEPPYGSTSRYSLTSHSVTSAQ